jgi:hypothetical protein
MARQQAEAKAALEAKVFLTQPKEPQAPFTTPQPFKLGPTVPSGGEPGGQRWGTSATVRRGWGGVGWGKMGWELGLPSTRSRELQLCNEELSACTCVWRVCQGTAGCVGATSPKDTCFARARLSACASAHVYSIQRSRSPPPPQHTHTHTHTHTVAATVSTHSPHPVVPCTGYEGRRRRAVREAEEAVMGECTFQPRINTHHRTRQQRVAELLARH